MSTQKENTAQTISSKSHPSHVKEAKHQRQYMGTNLVDKFGHDMDTDEAFASIIWLNSHYLGSHFLPNLYICPVHKIPQIPHCKLSIIKSRSALYCRTYILPKGQTQASDKVNALCAFAVLTRWSFRAPASLLDVGALIIVEFPHFSPPFLKLVCQRHPCKAAKFMLTRIPRRVTRVWPA